jgi:ATP-dependent helicase/DNAse subunit B
MSTFTIYTDLWESQKEKCLQEVLQKAKVGDRVLYQGPNQMDQTWYRIIETNGERSLNPIIVSYDEY